MEPISVWMFLGKSLYKAAANTAGFFNLDFRSVATTLVLFGFGYFLHWRIKGFAATRNELSTTVILTVAPFCLFFSALFVFNCVKAPYLQYVEEFNKAKTEVEQANKHVEALEISLKQLENAPQSGQLSDAKKRLQIRTQLGILLNEAKAIMDACLASVANQAEPETSCEDSANKWNAKAQAYIHANLEPSYLARFKGSTGTTLGWSGADGKTNNILNFLNNHANALEQFIKEQMN